jgi:hypothetical protein
VLTRINRTTAPRHGVQHLTPTLTCRVVRTADGANVDVAYATPVLDGRNLCPLRRNTEIWAVL